MADIGPTSVAVVEMPVTVKEFTSNELGPRSAPAPAEEPPVPTSSEAPCPGVPDGAAPESDDGGCPMDPENELLRSESVPVADVTPSIAATWSRDVEL